MNYLNIAGQQMPVMDFGQTNLLPNSPMPVMAGGINGTNPALGFGKNLPTLNAALGGISTLGQLWGAFQQNKLAKQQFKYAKGVTETNMANQVQSYNTALDDRVRSRAVVEGQTPEAAAAYLDANKLRQRGV